MAHFTARARVVPRCSHESPNVGRIVYVAISPDRSSMVVRCIPGSDAADCAGQRSGAVERSTTASAIGTGSESSSTATETCPPCGFGTTTWKKWPYRMIRYRRPPQSMSPRCRASSNRVGLTSSSSNRSVTSLEASLRSGRCRIRTSWPLPIATYRTCGPRSKMVAIIRSLDTTQRYATEAALMDSECARPRRGCHSSMVARLGNVSKDRRPLVGVPAAQSRMSSSCRASDACPSRLLSDRNRTYSLSGQDGLAACSNS